MEKEKHINILELKAVLFALKAQVQKPFKHFRIITDNTTAVAYVNKMGGVKSTERWHWATTQKLWILAAHVSGSKNAEENFKYRNIKKSTEI